MAAPLPLATELRFGFATGVASAPAARATAEQAEAQGWDSIRSGIPSPSPSRSRRSIT